MVSVASELSQGAQRFRTKLYERVPKDLAGNLRWRKAIHQQVLNDPRAADAFLDACSRDILFYVNSFVWTFDPRRRPRSKLPMITYEFQDEAILELLAAIENSEDILIEKSRDMGASWICLIVMEWLWRFRPLQSFLIVSRKEEYVDKTGDPKSLFWKLDFIRDNLPAWFDLAGWDRRTCRNKLHLFNPANGSVFDGESTTGDVARTAILLDEFAAVEEGHRALKATRDATDTRNTPGAPCHADGRWLA